MANTIKEIQKNRAKKIEALKKAGFSAYPVEVKRTHNISEVLENFSKICSAKEEIILVGRIRAQREHGKAAFLDIKDGTGRIQVHLKEDKLGEKGYKFFSDNFDVGDFIEVRGVLFTTKKGEKTIEAADFKMLAKSLRPLPEKWHGIKDAEERFRKRYLDLLFNPEVKEKFEIRTKIIKELRDFLDKKGFLEVETPILQPIYGGATAKPFKTHLNALDIDLYLRISPELYLKRLLVGGLEKVYDLGKCFRNEGIDKSHNPDFTILEFYWAYADYKQLMKLTEEMLETVIKNIFGKLALEYEGKKINFNPPFPRIEYTEILKKYTDINYEDINTAALKKEAERLGIKAVGGKAEIADEIFKKVCRPKLQDPVFVIHYPAKAFPLAKPLDKDPKKSGSFQLIVAGMEIVKAFSELNDPILQKQRFQEQEKIFKEGFKEAQRMDKDFIEALEYGMPPAAGWGMGIDRLVLLLTNSHAVREIILFPTMRPK
ncbi:lysine--tRNA ligase [Patescibacteria group bacterium]|nr:lysine--tRNA ligase [Patescibacteria group bacterium]MBU4367928.1 lysine--tRNA ligase [Patescibacteria group bacterium]MBU4462266.1 lysine--tRNA ligase [Patescibacteria group bacterium]MCG2699538.1 lysine--tRNA ligase [Candidatus Parcubacteria bacterium]